MSEETFNIKFSEDGAENVIQKMRSMADAGQSATRSTEDLSDALGRVRNKANPAQAAYENLAKGIAVLDKAQKTNLITSGESARLQTNLIAQSSAALRPFSTMVTSIQAETRAWGENATARAVAQRVMSQTQTLQRAGVVLNAEERESLIAVNLAAVQARESAAATASAARQAAAEQRAAAAAAERTAAQEAQAAARRVEAISALQAKIGQETAALGLNTAERQANLRTIQQAESLRTTGITLSEEETAAIRAQNIEYAAQREAVSVLAKTQRELANVRNIGPTSVSGAVTRRNDALGSVDRASQLGLIGDAEKAQIERNITAAYAEQINPLLRTSSLLRERAEYITGLNSSGRTLATVEREIARATAEGAAASAGQIAGLRAQAREVDRLEKAYGGLKEAKGFLGNFVGGFGLLLGAGASAHAIDETQNVRNLVNVTSSGKDNQQDVTKAIYATAIATHAEVEDTAKLYTRLQLAGERYHIGQQQTLDLTKEVNQQIRLSGTSQGEATRAVLDFAHSISSGNVQFRELRALGQQAPFVSLQIAKGLTALAKENTEQGKQFANRAKAAGVDVGKRDITTGDFKELTSKRALTSGNIIEAQRLEAADTNEQFKKLQPTIAQATTDLKTYFLEFIDGANQSSGAGKGIADTIEFIGRNLNVILPVVISVGAALAGIFIVEKAKTLFDILAVGGSKLLGLKTGFDVTNTSVGRNNLLVTENSAIQEGNRKAIDDVTAALIRQNLARNSEITPAGAAAARAEAGVVPFGKRGVAGAGAGVARAAGAAEGAGVAAAEGVAAAGAAEAGAAGAGVLGTLAAGATVAIPLILGLGAAWLTLKDSINLAGEETTIAFKNQQTGAVEAISGTISLGDTVSGIFDLIGGASEDSAARQKAASADTASKDADAKAKQLDAAKNSFAQTGNYFDQLHSGLLKGIVSLVSNFGIGAIAISTAFRVAFDNMILGFEAVAQFITNGFADLYNNTVVKVANFAKDHGVGGGATAIGHVDFTSGRIRTRDKDQTEGDRATINAIRELPNRLAGSIINAAAKRQTQRPSTITNNAGDGLDDTDPAKAKKGKKDPFDNQFEELVKKVFPAVEAIRNLNKELAVLANPKAEAKLKETADQINKYNAQTGFNITGVAGGKESSTTLREELKQRLQDQTLDSIDPSRNFFREQAQKQAGLQADANSNSTDPFRRTIDREVLQKEQEEATQRKVNISLIDAEIGARLRETLTKTSNLEATVKLKEALIEEAAERQRDTATLGASSEVVKATADAYKLYKDALLQGLPGAQAAYEAKIKDNLLFIAQKENIDKTKAAYDQIVGPAKAYQDTVVNLNNLLDAGKISLAKYNEELRAGTVAALSDAKDGFSGFERGLLSVKKETEDTATDMQNTFKDAYDNIQSGFSSLFTGGSLKDAAHKVFEGLTNDLSKTLFHKLTDPLVNSVGSKFGIPGFGDKQLAAQRADITATNVYVNGADASSLGNLGLGSTPGATGFLGGNYNGLTNPFQPSDNGVSGLFGSASSLFGGNSNLLTGGLGSSTVGAGLDTLRLPGFSGVSDILGGTGGGLSSSLSGILGGLGGGGVGGAGAAAGGLLGGGGGGLLGGLFGGLLGAGKSAAGGASSAISGGLGLLANFLPPPFNLLGGLLGGGGGGGLLSFLPHFAVGGEGVVTGTGGTDSKLVSLMATPGESLQVKTPAQQREGQGGNGEPPQVNQKIVNVLDPQAALDAMSTGPGFKVLLNHIQSNPEAIKRALGT